jgi:hypothetical protein
MSDETEGFELIHSYTRKEAIEDGSLIDVSDTREAKELFIRFPIALTRSVWKKYVEVLKGVTCQDIHGRLWDILWIFRLTTRQSRTATDTVLFKVHVRNNNSPGTPPLVTLKGICGPGDQGEAVLTIMLPEED